MPLLTCIAIDDEPLALALIYQYASQIPELNLLQTFDDAILGKSFLEQNNVDILFVDIDMPDITGIDLVRSLAHKPMVIFTTAYKNFAFEGFELEALDYLLKPFDLERFQKAVKKAMAYKRYQQHQKPEENKSIFVRSEYRMVQIALSDIEYIEGLEDYIKIHVTNGRPILTLMTLKATLEKLPANLFIRIHRSYIVPLGKIKSVGNKKLWLVSEKELPVSDNYSSVVNELVKK